MHQLDDDTPAISSAERLALLIADALDAFSEPKNWIMPRATVIGPQPSLPIWKTNTSGIADPAAHAAAALSALGELAEAIKPSEAIASLPAQGVSEERPFIMGANHGYETAMEHVAEEARRYAKMYDAGSDGRNTFTLFAEWAEQAAFKPAALAPAEAGGVEARMAEHWRGKYRWLMWRIMWAQEQCFSHDLPDDVFAFLEADSADLRDNSFTCECGALVHHEDAFICNDGPTLCFCCKPDTAAEAGGVEAQPVAYRVRLAGDDPEEWQPLTVARALDFIDRKDYDCQPLYAAPAPVDALVKVAGFLAWMWKAGRPVADADEAWASLEAALAAYRAQPGKEVMPNDESSIDARSATSPGVTAGAVEAVAAALWKAEATDAPDTIYLTEVDYEDPDFPLVWASASADSGGVPYHRADTEDALVKAAEAIADDACSYICPSTGKAGTPIQHDPRCAAFRAAISDAKGVRDA